MPTFQPLTLTDAERADLLTFVRRGKASAWILTCAPILLQADAGWRDAEIIAAFHVSREIVSRVRTRFAAGGVAEVLTDQRQAQRRRALVGEQAIHLIALACTAAPLGLHVAAYQTIQVSCRLTGFKVADGNTWWYRIASSPWNNAFYAPADNYYNNGATSGSLIGTPFVDTKVPMC